jgi:hypothetical protein
VLQYCSLEQLQVDESYQRSLEAASSITLVRRIATFWDWGLCQPLFVARRADGQLYVVDGQHRMAAAKLRADIWQLPCVVRAFSNAEEEAAAFVAFNQERRPLNKLQIFKAALAAGDFEAAQIVLALDDAGLRISSTTNLDTCAPGRSQQRRRPSELLPRSRPSGPDGSARRHGAVVQGPGHALRRDNLPGHRDDRRGRN